MKIDSSELSKYYKIPLVGNKYQNYKPTNKDTDILLIKEDENIHDSNAVCVYSRRQSIEGIKLNKLGYIISDKTSFIRENFDNLKIDKIIRSRNKNNEGNYYYYLLISLV